MLKRILSIFLTIALLLTVSACTQKRDKDTSSKPKSSMEIGINDGVILPEIYEDDYQPNREAYQLGTCCNLKGNPTVIVFFVDDDESSWDVRSVNSYTNNYIKPGLRFLEDRAKEWSVDLKFNLKCFSTLDSEYEFKYEGVVKNNVGEDNITDDLLDYIANDMGYSNPWAMYSNYKYNSVGNNDVIFMHIYNKEGIAYANKSKYIPNGDTVEDSIIFAIDSNTPTINDTRATVAQLILFLFGAERIKAEELSPEFSDKYEDDIMDGVMEELSKNQITDLTAFRVGWTDEVPEVLKN